jgi:hypothetical protein
VCLQLLSIFTHGVALNIPAYLPPIHSNVLFNLATERFCFGLVDIVAAGNPAGPSCTTSLSAGSAASLYFFITDSSSWRVAPQEAIIASSLRRCVTINQIMPRSMTTSGPSLGSNAYFQHCNFSVDEGNSQRWAKAATRARWSVVEGTGLYQGTQLDGLSAGYTIRVGGGLGFWHSFS